jgi:hypothetical protein
LGFFLFGGSHFDEGFGLASENYSEKPDNYMQRMESREAVNARLSDKATLVDLNNWRNLLCNSNSEMQLPKILK